MEKKGEEKLTNPERKLTESREEMFAKLEKMGKTGYLEVDTSGKLKTIRKDKEAPVVSLKGRVDRFWIDITLLSTAKIKKSEIKDFPKSTINGKEISGEQAQSVMKKYFKVAISLGEIEKVRNMDRQLEKDLYDLLN